MFSLVVGKDKNGGIAKNGNLPWVCRQDLQIFKYLTTGFDGKKYKDNAVVMGYNTWKSLPNGPLPNRKNIIISKLHMPETVCVNTQENIEWYKSPYDFLMSTVGKSMHYWIIGGGQLYGWFLDNNLINEIYITTFLADFQCDLFLQLDGYPFKEFEIDVRDTYIKNKLAEISNIAHFKYLVFENKQECQLIDIIKDIITNGAIRPDRTGTGTISNFGNRAEFDLSSFPLSTARPQSLRWIFEELMWILRGHTDVSILEKKGINIWTPNSTKEFIDKQNLDVQLEAGNLGESYGHNMRNYAGCDQLAGALNLLKSNPTSRRIIINLWNSASVKRSALPPCLCWYQFYVREINNEIYLDCQAMNRSSDIVVAGGWNVTTAAMLVYILAAACGYKPGKLIWITGDTHIYTNNVNAAKQLMERVPVTYPKLFITKNISTLADILELEYADLTLIGYRPVKPQIQMQMNA